jgi:type III pantothenate kinase
VTILATGGFAAEIQKISPCFSRLVPGLLLDGLRLLYLENT